MATKITGTVSGEPLIEYEVGGVFVPWKQAIDNWVTVTAVTGSPTTGTYTDADGVAWKCYQWTGNGSVTVTSGIVDVLIVGGGGGARQSGVVNGGGGDIIEGLHALSASTHSVAVGAAGGYSNTPSVCRGGVSSIGDLATGTVGWFDGRTSGYLNNDGHPYLSTITGSDLWVSGGNGYSGQLPDYGGGHVWSPAQAGVVVIRVPSTFAQA